MKLTSAFLATAGLVVSTAYAQSSPGFPIEVSENFRLVYNESDAEVTPPGILLPRDDVLSAPTGYLPSTANASAAYIIIMIDIDVVRDGNTISLLHWLAPNMVAMPSALIRDNSTAGASTAVGASYVPPTPPGGSGPHRYTFLLFEQPDMWAVPASYVAINPPSDTSARLSFDIEDFISQSGLGQPVAANYLRVLNGTAAETSSAETMTATATATATGSSSMTMSSTAAASTTLSGGESATSAMASATPTDGAHTVKTSGMEMLAGLAMAVVGAATWML